MNDGLGDLLGDAKLIALYGQRAGRLKSAELFEAIAAFERLPAPGWGSPETAALQKAFNQAVADIAPTSLVDIKRRDPFSSRSRRDFWKTGGLIAFSIMLMVATAFFTVLYNRGSELAVLLVNIDKNRPAEKMAAIAREWNAAKFENQASSETYYKMLDELRELDAQVKTYLTDYSQFTTTIQGLNPLYYLKAGPRFGGQGNYPGVNSCGTVPLGDGQEAQESPFIKTPPGSILNQNKALIVNFACSEALTISPYSMPWLASLGSQIEKILKVLGFWVLPGLYGALGATIFYMRAILNPVLPDPPLEHMVHRVALGGFAGIIFAWFWAPSPQLSEQFAGLTINSFAAAFVIGFSVDVLFALLDRLVGFLHNLVSPAGPSESRLVVAAGPAVAASVPNSQAAPAHVIVRAVAPATVARGSAPAALTIKGDNLSTVRSVAVRLAGAKVEATGLKLVAGDLTCQVSLKKSEQKGDWTVETIDAAGIATAAAQKLTVT